ncbi:hypothetical protein GQ600_15037 [Phytophthora cactorum]|nr:hypothetical protein GQ600_15037 [Phytophthora cactorum]
MLEAVETTLVRRVRGDRAGVEDRGERHGVVEWGKPAGVGGDAGRKRGKGNIALRDRVGDGRRTSDGLAAKILFCVDCSKALSVLRSWVVIVTNLSPSVNFAGHLQVILAVNAPVAVTWCSRRSFHTFGLWEGGGGPGFRTFGNF